MKTKLAGSVAIGLLAATGCVSSGKYDAAVADARSARAEHAAERARMNRELNATSAELARVKRAAEEAETRCGEVRSALEGSKTASLTCWRSLDEAATLNDTLRKELTRRGQDVDKLIAVKGSLAATLEETRNRLEELRRAQAAAEVRAAIFQEVARKLKRMIDAGDLAIVLRSGRMVLVMPTDVLFDSGKAVVKPHGQEALAQVAAALRTIEGRRFQVAGHTDNEPIRISGFASNWELSAVRALKVVEFLIEKGMAPSSLSAAGYGEFDAVASNERAEERAKNRRIEITLQPNIDEMVPTP